MNFLWYMIVTYHLVVHCIDETKGRIICVQSGYAEKEQNGIALQESCNRTYNFSSKFISDLQNHTVIKFICSQCYLNFTLNIENLTNITITAASSLPVVNITCGNMGDAGMHFRSVSNLTISNIVFDNCGSMSQLPVSLDRLTSNISTALLFLKGRNLLLKNLTLMNSYSSGFIIFNVVGIVLVQNIFISRTKFLRDKVFHTGNIVTYSDTLQPTNVRVKNSSFSNNGVEADLYYVHKYTISSGLGLHLHRTANLTVSISHVIFHKNRGYKGGHMAVFLYVSDSVFVEPVLVLDSVEFLNGYGHMGGALYIAIYPAFTFRNTFLNHSTGIEINHCKFFGNTAIKSGGGIRLEWEASVGVDHSLDVMIRNCSFSRNTLINSPGGLAIYSNNYVQFQDKPYLHSKFQVNLFIEQCSFRNHTVALEYQPKSAVIFSEAMPFIKMTEVNITSNKCRAILAVKTIIEFQGNTLIFNNMASTGAGLQLCSNSFLYFSPQTQLLIIKNNASDRGGGIWVEPNCNADEWLCFYQYTYDVQRNQSLVNSVQFIVKDNSAETAGDNIYGGSIEHCFFLYSNNTKPWIKYPKNNKTLVSSVSSNPERVCILNNMNGSNCHKIVRKKIVPGSRRCFYIRLLGELRGAVPGVLTSSTRGSNISINSAQLVQWIPKKHGRQICFTMFKRTPDHSIEGKISLSTNFINDEARSNSSLNSRIHIEFKECPLGYTLSKYDQQYGNKDFPLFHCKCNTSYFVGSQCPYKKIPKFKKRNYSWIGIIPKSNTSHDFITSKYCPPNFCNSTLVVLNPKYPDIQCLGNRTGIMCGTCIDGWSMQFGNSDCVPHCTYMYLLLIIPFAIIGVVIVLLIGVLNITVTMGTINGIIFCSNILQDNHVQEYFIHSVPFLSPLLNYYMSWLNLDLGVPVCFYKGMGAAGKTLLPGLFPMYLWAISLSIIIISNKFVLATRILGNNAVKFLATLILLSYSKILRVTVGVFSITRVIFYYSATDKFHVKLRWALNGTLELDSYPHTIIFTFFLACILTVLLLPFTLSLLFVRQTSALSNYCKWFSFIDKLKPFFDAYTGILKDRVRYWPGLLLLCRIIVLVAKSIYPTDVFVVHFITSMICILLLCIMIKNNGVYTQNYLNVLESFYIANILAVLITVTSLSNKHRYQYQEGITLGLLTVSFLVTVGILGYHAYLKLSKYEWLKKCVNRNKSNDPGNDERRGLMQIESGVEDCDHYLNEFPHENTP